MNRIYELRCAMLLVAVFTCGALISGKIPVWLIIGSSVLSMRLYMIYDDEMYEQSMKRRGKRHDSRRRASSVPMQELQ